MSTGCRIQQTVTPMTCPCAAGIGVLCQACAVYAEAPPASCACAAFLKIPDGQETKLDYGQLPSNGSNIKVVNNGHTVQVVSLSIHSLPCLRSCRQTCTCWSPSSCPRPSAGRSIRHVHVVASVHLLTLMLSNLQVVPAEYAPDVSVAVRGALPQYVILATGIQRPPPVRHAVGCAHAVWCRWATLCTVNCWILSTCRTWGFLQDHPGDQVPQHRAHAPCEDHTHAVPLPHTRRACD